MSFENFGIKLKKLREEKNLTQIELAALVNKSNKTISKWETGRGYPDITVLPEIASIFNVPIEFFCK